MKQKKNHRIWILRRLKKLGASQEELLDTYIKQVRSILEYGVPVWHPGLSKGDSYRLERIQKTSLAVILGTEFSTYREALKSAYLEALSTRRRNLCLKFALKCEANPKYNKWFELNQSRTTRNSLKYKQVWTRTERYRRSPVPYLTDLLNEHYKKS